MTGLSCVPTGTENFAIIGQYCELAARYCLHCRVLGAVGYGCRPGNDRSRRATTAGGADGSGSDRIISRCTKTFGDLTDERRVLGGLNLRSSGADQLRRAHLPDELLCACQEPPWE